MKQDYSITSTQLYSLFYFMVLPYYYDSLLTVPIVIIADYIEEWIEFHRICGCENSLDQPTHFVVIMWLMNTQSGKVVGLERVKLLATPKR